MFEGEGVGVNSASTFLNEFVSVRSVVYLPTDCCTSASGAFNERVILQFEDNSSVPAADVLGEECRPGRYTFYGMGGFAGHSPGGRTALLDVM